MTLRHRLARQLACDPSAVGGWALFECVPPTKRPLYRLACWLQPAAFAQDVSVVEDALNALRPDQVKLAIADLHDPARRRRVFWRDWLGLRVSGRRLLAVALRGFEVGPTR
jgi:hypothetical protein